MGVRLGRTEAKHIWKEFHFGQKFEVPTVQSWAVGRMAVRKSPQDGFDRDEEK